MGGDAARKAQLRGRIAAAAEGDQTLQMGGGAVLIPMLHTAKQAAGRPHCQGLGQLMPPPPRGGTAPGEFLQGRKGGLGLLHQIGLVRPEAGGHLSQPGRQAGGHGLQLGQHPVTQAVAGVRVAPVGGVLPPGQAPEAEIRLDLIRETDSRGRITSPDGRRSPQSAQSGPRIRWSRMVSALSPALWAVAIHWPPQAWAVRRRKS